MKSHQQCLDGSALAATQTSGILSRLFTCEPLNLAELDMSSLVLKDQAEFSAPASATHDQLYLLLSGQVTASLSGSGIPEQAHVMNERGTVAYQPAQVECTLQAMGDEPAVLLVTRLAGLGHKQQEPFQDLRVVVPSEAIAHHAPAPSDPNAEKILVFDSPTEFIHRLYCFFLAFESGDVVPVHYHDCHGVLLILLDGAIETEDDGVLGPTNILYYRGGAPHGFKCVGNKRMLAFAIEFYREPSVLARLKAQLRETPLGDAWRAAKAVLPIGR